MPPAPEKPPADGGAIQRQRGFFGRRSVLESSGAVKPPAPPKPAEPEAAPAAPAPRADTKAGRKAARKAAARAAMAGRGATPVRSRRRTGTVALVLVGAAALGVGGAWVADRMTRPACNPAADPACQQASSSGSSGSGGGGRSTSSRSSSVSRSSGGSDGSWFSWGNDGSGVAAIPGGTARDTSVRRGGFGSIGRFFSSGG